jgi:hypothetical protein
MFGCRNRLIQDIHRDGVYSRIQSHFFIILLNGWFVMKRNAKPPLHGLETKIRAWHARHVTDGGSPVHESPE